MFKIVNYYGEIITISAENSWRYFRSQHTPEELREVMPLRFGAKRFIQFDIDEIGTILTYQLFEQVNARDKERFPLQEPRADSGKNKVWWEV